MSSKKRRRREREVEISYEDLVIEKTENEALASRNDSDLFFIDRKGSKGGKAREQKVVEKRNTQCMVSITERKLIRKTQARLNAESGGPRNLVKGLTDLWGVDIDNTSIVSNHKSQEVPMKLRSSKILPGHSYNPSQRDHQDALAEVISTDMYMYVQVVI